VECWTWVLSVWHDPQLLPSGMKKNSVVCYFCCHQANFLRSSICSSLKVAPQVHKSGCPNIRSMAPSLCHVYGMFHNHVSSFFLFSIFFVPCILRCWNMVSISTKCVKLKFQFFIHFTLLLDLACFFFCFLVLVCYFPCWSFCMLVVLFVGFIPLFYLLFGFFSC
jgi:hypothetical protein